MSRSRDTLTSRLALGYLRLVPKTLFCANFASHINKMSQIGSRYIMAVLSVYLCVVRLSVIIIIIKFFIKSWQTQLENKQ